MIRPVSPRLPVSVPNRAKLSFDGVIAPARDFLIIQNIVHWPSDSRGHKFESCWMRLYFRWISTILKFVFISHSGHSKTNKARR